MSAQPYIGITGTVSVDEVEAVISEFNSAGYFLSSSHIPMLGFLVSYKTLNGLPTENKRYPLIGKVRGLLEHCAGRVLPMIHYNSKEMSTLAEQVSRIFDGLYQDDFCRALQMNIVWPDVEQMKRIKKNFPELQIVFQASHNAMAERSSKEMVDKIAEYKEAISYVLIDPSGGRGLEFDINHSLAVYHELTENLPAITVGFAGGFTGANVEARVRDIISRTGRDDFCIDAEGGLRDKLSNNYGDDLLNMEKVKAYVQAAARVIKYRV